MLDVERGEHVDARVEQFAHVLVALGMARAGRVGVRQFIHQRELRMAREDRVEVHFGEREAAMLDGFAGDRRQAGRERVGFLASVGFDVTDDHVAPGGEFASGGFEHGVGLADAGGHAEKDLEPAALLGGLLALQ